MQEDAEYAKSLDEEPVHKTMTRASRQQQQMATVNDTVHLQNVLEMVTPLQVIPDSEEDDDGQPIKLAQLEQLEEIIHGQPYVPDHYEDNIHFHGSEPQGSPVEAHNEDSEWLIAPDQTAAFAARSDKCKEWKVNRACIDKSSLQQNIDTLIVTDNSSVNKQSQAYKLFSGKFNKFRNNVSMSAYK